MKKFSKLLSLLVAILMTLSLAACGNTPAPVSSSTAAPQPSASASESAAPASETPAGVSADLMQPFAKYPETVNLTFGRIMNRGATFAEGEDSSKNCEIDIIKDKLNVQCIIDWETSPDQYNQRLSLAVAGGTLPDVFFIQNDNYLQFVDLVDAGALADLTDAYNKCIGGLAAQELASYNGSQLKAATFDGKIMGIPTPVGGYNYNVLWIRQDWLDKVKMPLPKTVDDIKNVALAFKNAKLGGDNTVGIVVDPTKPLNTSDGFLSLSAIANSQGAYPFSWIKGSDGKVVYGSITPEMKNTLGILSDWYKAGVLDPQWMTYQNMDAVTPALRNGQCGMYYGAFWSPWTIADSVKQNPEMNWVPVLAPLSSDGKFNHINNPDPNGFIVVNKNCKNPEAVVKAANVSFELNNGAYDKDQAIVDKCAASKTAGSFGRTISPFSGCAIANIFDLTPKAGVAIYDYAKNGAALNLPSYAPPVYTDQANKCKEFAGGTIDTKSDKFTEYYSLFNSYAACPLLADPINFDEPVAYSYTTASMADYKPALDTMEKEMEVQIISGEKPLDYFDEFVKNWKASGGDTITAEVQAVIDAQGSK